jgi:hypothetical protein
MFSILDRVDNNFNDSLGGANQSGLKETASESGRAVMARQAQAGLDTFNALDNMRRTKQNLAVKIAWYLSNRITDARKLRITGDTMSMQQLKQTGLIEPSPTRPNVGYLSVNTKPENTIYGLEVDVVVDEAQHSPTKNMSTINQLTDAFKSGLIRDPIPAEAVIPLFNLPQSVEAIWLKSIEEAKQSGPKEPPASPISIKYVDLTPDAQEQALASLGIKADPTLLMHKDVAQHGAEPQPPQPLPVPPAPPSAPGHTITHAPVTNHNIHIKLPNPEAGNGQ